LEAAGRLPMQPWMTATETAAVVAALSAEGTEIRFVGGCVRDAVLGRQVRDIDIATHDRPEQVIKLLRAAGLKAVPTGIKHGTVTAVADGAHFEITTLRLDVETYGRHAKVSFTDDWAADAARRDFTMNALFLAPDGTLYDPFGGLGDLRAGRVRFVGDPEQRIREDVLRLLRFFRFFAHYGTPPLDAEGLAACRRLAHLLPSLSAERVAGETFKLLAAPDPAPVLERMAAAGVLDHVLPEASRFGRLAALTELEAELGEPDPLRRLAAMLDADAAEAEAVALRLKLSNQQRERLTAMVGGLPGFAPEADARARRRWFYVHGAGLYRDLLLLHWAAVRAAAGAAGAIDAAHYRDGLEAAAAWHQPRLPVKGADAMAMGVPHGPRVGELVDAVEQWWIGGDFQATRQDCLDRLRALAKGSGTEPRGEDGK